MTPFYETKPEDYRYELGDTYIEEILFTGQESRDSLLDALWNERWDKRAEILFRSMGGSGQRPTVESLEEYLGYPLPLDEDGFVPLLSEEEGAKIITDLCLCLAHTGRFEALLAVERYYAMYSIRRSEDDRLELLDYVFEECLRSDTASACGLLPFQFADSGPTEDDSELHRRTVGYTLFVLIQKQGENGEGLHRLLGIVERAAESWGGSLLATLVELAIPFLTTRVLDALSGLRNTQSLLDVLSTEPECPDYATLDLWLSLLERVLAGETRVPLDSRDRVVAQLLGNINNWAYYADEVIRAKYSLADYHPRRNLPERDPMPQEELATEVVNRLQQIKAALPDWPVIDAVLSHWKGDYPVGSPHLPLKEIVETGELPWEGEKRKFEGGVVYGERYWADGAIAYVSEEWVREVIAYNEARSQSKTWGEFLERVPSLYEDEILAHMENVNREEPIQKDDPFVGDFYASQEWDLGLGPMSPDSAMLSQLPRSVLRLMKHEENQWGDQFVSFCEEDHEEILNLLRSVGYSVREDEDLISSLIP